MSSATTAGRIRILHLRYRRAGRDVYSRVIDGARVSLMIGVTVAMISVAVGLVIGLSAGYIRWLDAVIMRIMDGLMAIPAILLAMPVSLSAPAC